MASGFPGVLDSFTNPTADTDMGAGPVPHATQHANLNDSVVAIMSAIGVTGSSVSGTLQRRLTLLENAGPSTTAPVSRTTAGTAVPLTYAGNGSAWPLVEGDAVTINADTALPVAAGEVMNGLWVGDFVSTGTGTLSFPGFVTYGTWTPESGRKYRVTCVKWPVGRFAFIVKGDVIDVTAPVLQTPTIANTAKNVISIGVVEANTSSLFGDATGVTLGGTNASSFSVLSVAYASGVLNITLSANALASTVLTVSLPGGYIRDGSGNLSAPMTAVAVTNNVVIGAPNAPTITPLAALTTSLQHTITPGAVDTAHGAATIGYQSFYRLAGSGGAWLSGGTSTSLTPTITGLSSGVTYDRKVVAIGVGGSSPDSNVLTTSTTTVVASSLSITDVGVPVLTDAGTTVPTGTVNWAVFKPGVTDRGGAGTISDPTAVNLTLNTSAAAFQHAYLDSDTNSPFALIGTTNDASVDGSLSFTIPATTTEQTLIFVFGLGGSPEDYTQYYLTGVELSATFADSSHAPAIANFRPVLGYEGYEHAAFITFKSASATTMTVKLRIPGGFANAGAGIGIHMVAVQ